MHSNPADSPSGAPPDSRPCETVWSMRTAVGAVVRCTIHPVAEGYVVRVRHGETELQVCTLATVGRARRKADHWRDTLLSLSGFGELSVGPDDIS
jgi:hypothetical protein